MKFIKFNLFIAAVGAVFSACDPIEDRETLGERIPKSEVKFTVTQQQDFANRVFLENQTPNTIALWEYKVGAVTFTSNRVKDTVTFIFPGEYWIKFKAYGQGGASDTDSVKVTVTNLCGDCITDPGLIALTNKTEGKYWKLFRVSLGPATPPYNAAWGDVSWWSQDAYNWNDSAYFDLDNAFNYKRYHNGQVISSGFLFDKENLMIAGNAVPGNAISILGGNQMSIKDGSNEMAEANKARYRVYRLDADTLVVGQGAYYTPSRAGEDWGYYHWYVSVK
jgi:hypothetical protein